MTGDFRWTSAFDLADIRTSRGISQADLGSLIGYSRSTIADWEAGRSRPNRETILRIGDLLNLTREELNSFLYNAEYETIPLPDSAFKNVGKQQILHSNPTITEPPVFYEAINEMQVQVKDIQGSIEALGEILEEKLSSNADKEPSHLMEELQNAKDALRRLETTSRDITAPVSLPSADDLTVKLVPSTLLERLEEYRAEENKWSSWLGIFVGAIFGVFINLVTGGSMSNQAWVILALLVIMVCLTGWTARTYRQRANRIKMQLFQSKEQSIGRLKGTDKSAT